MNWKALRKRGLFDRFVLILNIFTLVALLLTYLAAFVSPTHIWQLAFVAMGYPIILAAITIFMLYWLLRRRWFLFLNLAFILLRWSYVSSTVKVFPKSNAEEAGINVMTYNVRLFDKYNWTEEKNAKNRTRKFILDQQPNILCIQEYYNGKGDSNPVIDLNSKRHKLRNMHLKNYYAQRNNKNDFGIATITSYPIVNKGTVVLENSRSALTIYTDLLINQDTIRVYNVHLQSIHLGDKGYRVLDDLMESQELDDVADSKVVLARLKQGFIKRAVQADKIADHIANSPYPVIVCGDFNDVPTSYTYQSIAKLLDDSFAESGAGLGSTFVRVPFFRIDNILYSKEFESSLHTVHPHELSDHLAVSAVLSLKD